MWTLRKRVVHFRVAEELPLRLYPIMDPLATNQPEASRGFFRHFTQRKTGSKDLQCGSEATLKSPPYYTTILPAQTPRNLVSLASSARFIYLKMGRKVTLATCSLNQWALDFRGNLERILKSKYS